MNSPVLKWFSKGCRFLFILTIILIKPFGLFSQTNGHYNVLMIIVDDLNEKASVFDYPTVLTPNLQRLANHGVVFKKAYAQFALCSPSRTSLLSGWRPDKTGIYDNNTSPRSKMGQQVKFLPEYFGLYGYHTERVGKIMHGSYQDEIAWDYSDKTRSDDFSSEVDQGAWWVTNLVDAKTPNGVYAGAMVKRMQLLPPQPFFLALGLTVHGPFTPSLKYWNMYGTSSSQQLLPVDSKGNKGTLKGNGSGNIALPNTPTNDRNDVPAVAFPTKIVKTTTDWQNTRHAYFAEVTEMDAQLGTVLDEMDRQNLWQNTVVVLISDHGQHLGEHVGLWGKYTLFEESNLAPLIVCVPGKTAGTCNALVEYVDIYPSLAEICSLPAPSGMEGSSFAKLLDNVNTPWKRAVFSMIPRAVTIGRSASTAQYRYNNWGSGKEELYDHATDPLEYTNLADDKAYSSQLSMMQTIFNEGWTKSLPPGANISGLISSNSLNIKPMIADEKISAKIFPNPSKGNVIISLTNQHAGVAALTVYNISGKAVFKTTTEISDGVNNISLHLSSLASGIYSVEIKNKEMQQRLKLVIEK